ncbi:hypothetical protein BJX99DRAFT_257684 [Aspergillus californicus]
MDITSLAIGLGGLIPLVEKSLQLWQSIAEAKEFGSEMMRIVAMLAIEYHRFLSWARFLQSPSPATHPQPPILPNIGLLFPDDLSSQLQSPIESAAARVVTILGEIADIAGKYKLQGTKSTSVAKRSSALLPIVGAGQNPNIAGMIKKNREWARMLQEQTSLRRRFTFTSRPWGKSDHSALEKKVGELSYWNDRLEGLLPETIRQSVSHQAPLTQILVDENEALLETLIKAAEHQNEGVRTHATLWKERLELTKTNQGDRNIIVEKYRSSVSALGAAGTGSSKCELSLATFQQGQSVPILTVIEWYPFGGLTWSASDISLAISRLAQIVHLTSLTVKPGSLRILECVSFVEDSNSLGLVARLPVGASSVKHPVSLHCLLSKVPEVVTCFRPPSLEERLQLSKQLASSIYSFALVRWCHKDINSRNVVFFRDTSPSASIILNSPYMTGFSISRPDSRTEKSLNKDLEARAIYLHYDLRISDPEERPGYHLKYEMYSLGLLLFEIGIWNTIDRVVKSSLPPKVFHNKVIDRCTKDLPFFMGSRYRDVVLLCLTSADDAEESDSLLDTLYWSVVLELAKCQ